MRTERVTTLKRQATELLFDLERDKQPILITRRGLPSAYLLDVESYQLMQQRMAVLEGIALGEQVIAEGRVATHAQSKKRLARWLNASSPRGRRSHALPRARLTSLGPRLRGDDGRGFVGSFESE